jgi:hypothetical protein
MKRTRFFGAAGRGLDCVDGLVVEPAFCAKASEAKHKTIIRLVILVKTKRNMVSPPNKFLYYRKTEKSRKTVQQRKISFLRKDFFSADAEGLKIKENEHRKEPLRALPWLFFARNFSCSQSLI